MRDIEIPYGYQMKNGAMIEHPVESNIVRYIFQKINSYADKPPIWGEMSVKNNMIFCEDEPKCSTYQFAKCYLTRELNMASELLHQCGDQQMQLTQILEDEGYKAAIRKKIVDEGIYALLLRGEQNWQGVTVTDKYEALHAQKTEESKQLHRLTERSDIITPEQFAAAQSIIMKHEK
ncbi:hypothetical protein [Hungatella effluvii]|uniref:hypothetical protein n=1 Tax=Hungatella effluvii TaxID=1096246 RepID=UPI0022E50E92|nr:hypothetical protein [Hungatella effluvii]